MASRCGVMMSELPLKPTLPHPRSSLMGKMTLGGGSAATMAEKAIKRGERWRIA